MQTIFVFWEEKFTIHWLTMKQIYFIQFMFFFAAIVLTCFNINQRYFTNRV